MSGACNISSIPNLTPARSPPGHTPETATASTLAPYADQYYQYDSSGRVTETIVQGAGCSCSGSTGQGTFTYAYTASSNTAGPNSWAVKTVETLPDGNQNIVYTNAGRRGDGQRLRRHQRPTVIRRSTGSSG